MEYLGFWVTLKVARPISKKVDTIKKINQSKDKHSTHIFIVLINYYRDMWASRSHTI